MMEDAGVCEDIAYNRRNLSGSALCPSPGPADNPDDFHVTMSWGLNAPLVPFTHARSLLREGDLSSLTSLVSAYYQAGEEKVTIGYNVVSMSEELRRALYSSGSLTSLDLEAFLPEIVGTSEIITDIVRKNMYKKLPARAQGYSWKLVFSTSQNGFSLNSLYRKMSDVETPVMLFIQDTHQNVFGAVVSGSLHVSELYYGTGESFLFSFHPEFQVFPWTGENTFFVRGNNESLIVGGGDGNFGLWLDGDLYQGRTQPCKTYNNPQLTDSEDFIIKSVECWCFE